MMRFGNRLFPKSKIMAFAQIIVAYRYPSRARKRERAAWGG
jgi:hypothetical protein